MKLSPSCVLAFMKPGQDYTATRLSLLIGATTTMVGDSLRKLVEDGRVEVSRSGPRSSWFRLAKTEGARELAEPDDGTQAQTSVATFPVTRVMVGSLSGYDAALMARRDLVTQTRGRSR
jgi:hypothetical protein